MSVFPVMSRVYYLGVRGPNVYFFSIIMMQRWLALFSCVALSSLLLVSCSGIYLGWGADNQSPMTLFTSAASQVALAQLHWCGKPLMLFLDKGASPAETSNATGTVTATTARTPTTITNWAQVRSNLGFTLYLPATLPSNTCLTSVWGTTHDPIFGGSLTIGYLIPGHSSLSLSEVPLHSQHIAFQCSASPTVNSSINDTKGGIPTTTPGATVVPLQLCTGARDTTNIVFSAHGTAALLQQFFTALQPNVDWLPTT